MKVNNAPQRFYAPLARPKIGLADERKFGVYRSPLPELRRRLSVRRRTARLFHLIGNLLFSQHLTEQDLSPTPRGVPSDSPSRALAGRRSAVMGILAIGLPAYLILALIVPPFDDEFYYWCWSRDLQFSYFDHPGMVAWTIRLATSVFGHSIFAIRIPAVISCLTVLGVVAWLSRPRTLIAYIFLSPVPMFANMMITPDVPLLMFWALYLLWLVHVNEQLSAGARPPLWMWALGGVVLGCGMLGKYTMGLAAVCGSASFLFAGPWRRWLPGYLLHAAISAATASPILIYNIQHDFAPLRFQWAHLMTSEESGFIPFIEFVGVELLLFGSLPFVVLVWGLRRWRGLAADPRLRACACLFLLPFGYFLYKSTRGHLEANWPFPCYIACWPLAAELYSRMCESRLWRRLTVVAFALPVGATAFILIHAIHPWWFFPVDNDRATRQWDKMALTKQAADGLRESGYTGPVYASTYQWVALLRWQGVDARQADAATRPSHFTTLALPPADPSCYVFFLETVTPVPDIDSFRLGKFRRYSSYQLVVRGEPGPYFHWIDLSSRPVLPPPIPGEIPRVSSR